MIGQIRAHQPRRSLRLLSASLTVLLLSLFTSIALAGGGAPAATKTNFDWEKSPLKSIGESFFKSLSEGEVAAAYKSGDELLRSTRDLKTFTADMTEAGFTRVQSVAWENGIPSKDGYRLIGTVKLSAADGEAASVVPWDRAGAASIAFVLAFVALAVRSPEWRDCWRDWCDSRDDGI